MLKRNNISDKVIYSWPISLYVLFHCYRHFYSKEGGCGYRNHPSHCHSTQSGHPTEGKEGNKGKNVKSNIEQ